MTKNRNADIIKEICKKIEDSDVQAAKDIVNKKYPHEKLEKMEDSIMNS